MSCHRHNPATVSFPGYWGPADWHPPLLSLFHIPLKESNEAAAATHYVVHTPAASSSLPLFSNHRRNRPLLSEQRALFVFCAGLLFQACSFVCVCWPLMYTTPTFADWTIRAPRQQHAERKKTGGLTKERRSVFLPSQSLMNSFYNWMS